MVIRVGMAIASLALLLSSCADAPFARTNVNDPAAKYTGHLVLSRDTVSVSNPYVAAQLVLDPVINGYFPVWSASSTRLSSLGGGVYRLIPATPGAPPVSSVEIRATFLSRSFSATVHIAPTP